MTAATNVVKLPVKETGYDTLVKQGLALVKEQENTNWQLGELASKVVKKYHENRLGQFAQDIGVEAKHLANCRTTCQKWPQKSGRPDFWTAYLLNPHPNRFKIVAKNPDITWREARAKMQEYNAKKLERQQEKEDIAGTAIEDGTALMIDLAEPVELENKADAKSVLEISDEGRADNATEAATRWLYNVACEVYSLAKKAELQYLDKANLEDKHVIKAIRDAAKAWQELSKKV